MSVTADIARTTWQALEPYHAMIYFVPEAQEEYGALGYDVKANPLTGYFPARAAAMGAVGSGVVLATFYNWSPAAVELGMTGAWAVATPEQVLEARLRAADRALRRMCGDALDDPSVSEAAALAGTAAEACSAEGRPLYAAHARLPWPEEPHLALWHAQTLLREHRGDGHIAALVAEGIGGLEAAVLHVAVGDSWRRSGLQRTRVWTDEQWDGAIASLTEAGWLQDDGTFTDEGRARRQRVEDLTDELSVAPYAALGADGCRRLREIAEPLREAVIDGGGYPLKRK